MALTTVKIRAEIASSEGKLKVVTPYITSFNVSCIRGTKSTFSASVKVKTTEVPSMKGKIQISAGVDTALNLIFTGYIKSASPTPCWDDPTYCIVNLSGQDEMYKLENVRFTRRQVKTDTCWALITSLTSPGNRPAYLHYASNARMVYNTDDQNKIAQSSQNKNKGIDGTVATLTNSNPNLIDFQYKMA